MTELIKAYHGTKDLQGIVKDRAILPKYYLERGKGYWEEKKMEYDIMSKDIASRFRRQLEGEPSFADRMSRESLHDGSLLIERFPEIMESNEFLADSFFIRNSMSAEALCYSELVNGLTICLAYRLGRALPHEGFESGKKIGAILQLEFPIGLLRPSNYAHMMFMGRLDLKYLKEIFASKENFERVIQLLTESGLGKVQVNKLTNYDQFQ